MRFNQFDELRNKKSPIVRTQTCTNKRANATCVGSSILYYQCLCFFAEVDGYCSVDIHDLWHHGAKTGYILYFQSCLVHLPNGGSGLDMLESNAELLITMM